MTLQLPKGPSSNLNCDPNRSLSLRRRVHLPHQPHPTKLSHLRSEEGTVPISRTHLRRILRRRKLRLNPRKRRLSGHRLSTSTSLVTISGLDEDGNNSSLTRSSNQIIICRTRLVPKPVNLSPPLNPSSKANSRCS